MALKLLLPTAEQIWSEMEQNKLTRDLKVVKFILTQEIGDSSVKMINSKRRSKVSHRANEYLLQISIGSKKCTDTDGLRRHNGYR